MLENLMRDKTQERQDNLRIKIKSRSIENEKRCRQRGNNSMEVTMNKMPGSPFQQCQSTPFCYRERCAFDTLVDPANTGVVASQTRLDGPQTDLGRRPCRDFSARVSSPLLKLSRDTLRVIPTSLMYRVASQRGEERLRLSRRKS